MVNKVAMDQFDDDREITAERVIVVSKLARDVERSISTFDSTVQAMRRLNKIYIVTTAGAMLLGIGMVVMLIMIYNVVSK
jgi:hypothetical protein